MPDMFDSRTAGQRMALSREWEHLVGEVRATPGFEEFLKPPELADLLPAAERGPVVIVNVSRWRCDALIVTSEGVSTCPLPGLTAEDAVARTNVYLHTLQAAEWAAAARDLAREQLRDAPIMAHRQAVQAAERVVRAADAAVEGMLLDLCRWMWQVIAEPILDALDLPDCGGDPLPRLWWCSTGALTLLPLHAAGYHDDPPPRRRTVLDRVVSSYTPTLRALLAARQPLDRLVADDDRLLTVGVSEVVGQLPLPGVAAELATLAELVPDRRTDLVDGAATRDEVLRALRTHRWAHFSCHGNQDLNDPAEGGLVLADGVLRIADITSEQYHAEFAGLSACKTATGGITLLDEAITLVSALHYTGYRHVIGTLWSVYDSPGTTGLFSSIYQDLADGGRLHPERSAYALHRATIQLRDTEPRRPSTWTPFIHVGP
ncbi:CHAT domain-containing protein [Amycolatopsis vastitatis]|uniref:CHAT domain-containing protein n=1 Tax=Amycolatopsis vastitatis TaxID=1905142 RepID=A0A229SNQ8_9PSEU|nr:CHAT domain-containing protein [Amycolatopsis vastitatis]OXM60493.1 hypothetical protein CF165_42485 [Amycolatopsis vastitatis]